MGYDWNFSVFAGYASAFWRGLLVTIELSVISSVAGTLLGIALAVPMRARYVGSPLRIANDFLRAIPLLVLLFFFYYFPYRDLLGISPPSPFFSAACALTLAQANFTAEVVRAAIDGVSQKTILGARSLGLQERTIWLYIVFPDVLRQTLPTLISFYIGNVKLSSLASVIGAEDVVYIARMAVSQTFRSMEAWVVVGAIYAALVVPFTFAARKFEESEWMRRRS